MMMQSSVCGMLVLTGGSEEDEPGIGAFEGLASQALSKADADGSGQVGYDEFVGERVHATREKILLRIYRPPHPRRLTTPCGR